MKKSNTRSIDRKRVSEALLADRLGLDEHWIERWKERGEWREQSRAPERLPKFIRTGLKTSEIGSIERDVDRLVAAGCQRRVVYFCLEQLSPDSIWLRAGGEQNVVLDGRAEESEDLQTQKLVRTLATREDLENVVNAAKAARRLIHRYQRELMLAAESAGSPLPIGPISRPQFAEDALSLLQNSLTWAAQLASAYTAPFESTLLKSKGVLYLTLYASLFADSRKVKSSRSSTLLWDRASPSGTKRAKREYLPDNPITGLLSTVTGKAWKISELRDKLDGFKADHPRLYNKLAAKLGELHEFASKRCHRLDTQ